MRISLGLAYSSCIKHKVLKIKKSTIEIMAKKANSFYRQEPAIYGRGHRHPPTPEHDERIRTHIKALYGTVRTARNKTRIEECEKRGSQLTLKINITRPAAAKKEGQPVAKKTPVVRKTILKPLPTKKPRPWQNGDFYKPEQIPYIPEGDKYVHVYVERTAYMIKSVRAYGFITYPLATKCYKADNIDLQKSKVVTFKNCDIWSYYLDGKWKCK